VKVRNDPLTPLNTLVTPLNNLLTPLLVLYDEGNEWGPHTDGVTFPSDPMVMLRKGLVNDVRIVLGAQTNDSFLFLSRDYTKPGFSQVNGFMSYMICYMFIWFRTLLTPLVDFLQPNDQADGAIIY
jgi:hypothetical protein